MIVIYSKSFEKAIDRLSGKILDSIVTVIKEVKKAERPEEISNCIKIQGFHNVYRIKTGGLRAFFTFHIHIEGNTVKFEYLVPRGQAYNKNIISSLRQKDK
jgi:mRNA-degrading endonuclease RelE of RelBE toxin-antitoxin system